MSPRPVNPTPPILLALVTLLFAVTWNYDRPAPDRCPAAAISAAVDVQPAPLSTCALRPVSASGGAPAIIVPVSDLQPVAFVTLVDVPQSDAMSDVEPPRTDDWLAALLHRAARNIVR